MPGCSNHARTGELAALDRPVGLFADTSYQSRELTAAIYNEITSRQDIDKLDDNLTFLAAEFREPETTGAPP